MVRCRTADRSASRPRPPRAPYRRSPRTAQTTFRSERWGLEPARLWAGKHSCRGSSELLDVLLLVRERQEHGFELRRGEVDPFVDHPPEVFGKPCRVGAD